MRCNYYLISCSKCRHQHRQIANMCIFINVSKNHKKIIIIFFIQNLFFSFSSIPAIDILNCFFPFRVTGGLEALPAQWLRARRGCQFVTGRTHRDRQPFTSMAYLESPVKLICLSLTCGRKPETQRELRQPERKCKLHQARLQSAGGFEPITISVRI